MSNTTVTDELMLAVKHLGFSTSEIRDVIISGFKSTFQHFSKKKKMLQRSIEQMDEILTSRGEAEDSRQESAAI